MITYFEGVSKEGDNKFKIITESDTGTSSGNDNLIWYMLQYYSVTNCDIKFRRFSVV